MIIVKDLHKAYNGLEILKGVDLEIRAGELVSVVGSSGAGKTTLLTLLGTLERPDKGQLLYEGEDVFRWNDKKLSAFRNRNIGFVFQFHQLLPEFTALENVCMPAWIAGSGKKQSELEAMALLEGLGLAARAGHKPSELSGGEQQRVAVARALINKPRVVLADEPSGNLDSENAKDLHALFFRLREQFRQTFVIVTHNTELAAMADRKLSMIDGRILI